MIRGNITTLPSMSTEMSKLLDFVVFLNMENILVDYSCEKNLDKLIFRNSTSAGYFMFQLEIIFPNWKWNNKIVKMIKNEIIISDRI